ncbi:Integrase, catalytic region [gamma proteobacterium HdN1]|nr:Integrase, catalytic region [gamma proteobacterium HdN1]
MPANKLSDEDEQEILNTCQSAEFADMPAAFIVNTLLDRGEYIASESTIHRVLRKHEQNAKRGNEQTHRKSPLPDTFTATKPGQVLTWDITYMPSQTKGVFYYLYMIQDLYSRKAVGFEVYSVESGELAASLLERTLLSEGLYHGNVVLHSDNGAAMKSQAMYVKMEELGVLKSHSRARVSNDNPFIESFFHTLKYHRTWPKKGFKTITDAREWAGEFIHWYNHIHKHSKLNYVTPNERHLGLDQAILAKRERRLMEAKGKHPERWIQGKIRNCEPVPPTTLNPKKLVKPEAAKIAA